MNAAVVHSETEFARSDEAFWRQDVLTPTGRRSDDLRNDIDDLRERISAGERERSALGVRLTTLEERTKVPINAGNVVWSGKALLGAIGMSAAIIGGSYIVNGEARSASSKILTLLEERTRAQDKINEETKAAIEDVKRDIRATEERIKAEIRMKEYAKANGLKQP